MDEDSQEARFKMLISKMKELVLEGNVAGALKTAKNAQAIKPSDKLAKRIAKMEDYLLDTEENDEGEDVVEVGNGFFISKQLEQQLYPYQREGVAWMYKLFEKRKGGILADDMGLGKTIQVITFLTGLFDQLKIKHVLIVLPATLMNNWSNEFQKWSPSLRIADYQGDINTRQRDLLGIQRSQGILITTYGLVGTSYETLSQFRGREFVWDYVVLDEGHKIKNPTKCRTAVNSIPARNRLLLTGTPIQNNLAELWSLFDFVHHGTLLGTRKTFKTEFETPITRSREKNASINEKKLGEEMAKLLMTRVKPYLLRRTKAQLLENVTQGEEDKGRKLPKQLVQKNDLVIWLRLSDDQIRIYKDFLHSERVKDILMTKKSPLVELTILKKLCDHPRLLSAAACSQLGLDVEDGEKDYSEDDGPKLRIDHVSDSTLLDESGKMKFVLKLLDNLINEGHRVLIFSQSRKLLDIIERILKNKGFRMLRLDGTIVNQRHRQDIVNKFEINFSYKILLLTVQVGGVGLNLTSADRVIIYDPSWNPASDSQAVDRAYRIGQVKPVVVYRLITCSTVEEKIYRRQVFKESIYRETTGGCQNTYRYFTSFELKDMFTLDDPEISKTQMQLEKIHTGQRKATIELDEHIAHLYSFDIFGISDNDLLFTVKEEDNDFSNPQDQQAVGNMLTRANKLLNMECELTEKARHDQNVFKTPKLPEEESRPRRVQKLHSPVDFDMGTDKSERWSSKLPGEGAVNNLTNIFSKLSHGDVTSTKMSSVFNGAEPKDKFIETVNLEDQNSPERKRLSFDDNKSLESTGDREINEESSFDSDQTPSICSSEQDVDGDNKIVTESFELEDENSPERKRLSSVVNKFLESTGDRKINNERMSQSDRRSFASVNKQDLGEDNKMIIDDEADSLKSVDSNSFDHAKSENVSELSGSVIESSVPSINVDALNDVIDESCNKSFQSLPDIDSSNSELETSSSLDNSNSDDSVSTNENTQDVEESDLEQSNLEQHNSGDDLLDVSVNYDDVENTSNASENSFVFASKRRRKSMLHRIRIDSDSD